MPNARTRKYSFFVGTDVSRDKLDHAVMQGTKLLFHRQTGNDQESIRDFIAELKRIPGFGIAKAVFCMENTGYYCNPLLNQLQKARAHVVVEGAKKIRNSLGNIRGKNDKIDAIRIADYAYKSREHPNLWQPKRPLVQQLAQLNTLRARLIGVQKMLRTPLREQAGFVKKSFSSQTTGLNAKSIAAVTHDIQEIESAIDEIVSSDERLKRLVRIITSVRSVGPVTALHIIIATNEFTHISDPKKFACYAGVAPFLHQSGKLKGRATVSHMANKKMKALLHMCALNAKRSDPDLKDYYERKTSVEGKPKMAVINAIRYKLILRIFACVAQDRLYETVYCRTDVEASSPQRP